MTDRVMIVIATNAAVAVMVVAMDATAVTGADAARVAASVARGTKRVARTALKVHQASQPVATNRVATSRAVRSHSSRVVTKARVADVVTVARVKVRVAKAVRARASRVVKAASKASASHSKRVLRVNHVSRANRGRHVSTESPRKHVSRLSQPLRSSQQLR